MADVKERQFVSDFRLLVPLTQDRCLARLGPGARVVALISAAHAGRVALIWPAYPGRRQGQERLKRGLPSSKPRCPPGSTTTTVRASEEGVSTSTTAERVVIGMDPHKRSATIEVMSGDESIRGGGRLNP